MGEVEAIGCHCFMGGMTRGMMEALDVHAQYEVFNLGELTVEHNMKIPFYQADDPNVWLDVLRANPTHDRAAVLFGNPRCTGFSKLGHGCSEDAHGAWSKPTIDIKQLCWMSKVMKGPAGKGPLIWGFESVQDAATTGRPLLDLIHEEYGAGYRRAELFHNASMFGNAQSRARVIFLWYKEGISLPVEEITEQWLWRGPHVTTGQALRGEASYKGLINLWDKEPLVVKSIDEFDTLEKLQLASPWMEDPGLDLTPDQSASVKPFPILNHHYQQLRDGDKYMEAGIQTVLEGRSLNHVPVEVLEEAGWDELAEKKDEGVSFSWHAPRRLHRDKACPVIYSASHKFIHPNGKRPMSVRDLARIMGFDDDFAVLGSVPIAQLGKGLCVHVGRWLGYLCKAAVEGTVKRAFDPGHNFEQFRLDNEYGWKPKKPNVEKHRWEEEDE